MKKYDKNRSAPITLNPIEATVLISEMLDVNIVPFETSNVKVNDILKSMSQEEARACKRKFRKLWRKALRRHYIELQTNCRKMTAQARKTGKPVPNVNDKRALVEFYGEPCATPLPTQLRARRERARIFIWSENVVPKLNEIAEKAEK